MSETTEIAVDQQCSECGKVRTISWTRMKMKNAGGGTETDYWQGFCPDNHAQPQELHP